MMVSLLNPGKIGVRLDPVFEPGDIYPGGPRSGKHAVVLEVVGGDFARRNGVGVMVILEERDVSKMN